MSLGPHIKYSWENPAKRTETIHPLAKYHNVKICPWHKKQIGLIDNGYDLNKKHSKFLCLFHKDKLHIYNEGEEYI